MLIEDAGETLMREDLLWGGTARGTQNYPRRLCWGVVFVDRRPGIFIPTEVTVTSFFLPKQQARNSRRCRNRVLCAEASFDEILGLNRSGNVMFRRFVYLASVRGDQYREEEFRTA